MEENVALDSKKQKQFVKSIKGIKNLIKKNEKKADDVAEAETKKSKKHLHKRGLVYLSHIPHGFYEHQMTQYFRQFGVVTNARVIRSKHTGNSKGYAFVEFKDPAVGEIVAETMNNYLMGKRLIKAVYIPPEKQRRNRLRMHWNQQNNPGYNQKLKQKQSYNAPKETKEHLAIARKLLNNLTKTKKQLSEMGINYDFFTPVDVPESLHSNVVNVQPAITVKTEPETKENKKNKSKQPTDSKKVEKVSVKEEKTLKKNKAAVEKEEKPAKKATKSVDENKDIKPIEINQKDKSKDLKRKGVKPLEEFIKVGSDDENSDGSLEFDSDEYEKMIDDDDDEFDSESEGEENSDEEASGDESDIEQSNDDVPSEDDDDASDSDDESEEEM